MNKTRNKLMKVRSPAGRTAPDPNAKETAIPEYSPRSCNPLLYIEEIHYRAETVTPLLKEIPGYSPELRWN